MTEANTETAIEIKNLRKTYRTGIFKKNNIQALKGVSFSVKRGEILGILGPNGAGKTTLIKSLLGILKHEGEVSVAGEKAGSLAARRKSGYLPENIRLPEYLTGQQCLSHFGQVSGVPKRDIQKRMDGLISRVGMDHAADRKTGTYSKGMLQRIGLATALVSDPEVLFLDEPTDGLDPVGRRNVRVLLKEVCQTGKTVVVNSHLLHELELICDRVAVLQQGRLITIKKTAEFTEENQHVIFSLTTITKSQFELIQKSFQKIFPNVILTIQQDGSSSDISLPTLEQTKTDCLVDLLRKENLSIQSLSREVQSLEEAFLGLIEETEGEEE